MAYFLEASSATVDGPYDLSLVEGSVTTAADAERIQEIRRASRHLVTIGACATAGGVQALRNFGDVAEFAAVVYAQPEYISTLERSTPISANVPVDFEPPRLSHRQGSAPGGAVGVSRRPPADIPSHSVCVECKAKGNVCVLVAHGTPCLGPVTHAGCGALCPTYHRGCYGCFGPMEDPDTDALIPTLRHLGMGEDDVWRVFHTFNAYADGFREAVPVPDPGLRGGGP